MSRPSTPFVVVMAANLVFGLGALAWVKSRSDALEVKMDVLELTAEGQQISGLYLRHRIEHVRHPVPSPDLATLVSTYGVGGEPAPASSVAPTLGSPWILHEDGHATVAVAAGQDMETLCATVDASRAETAEFVRRETGQPHDSGFLFCSDREGRKVAVDQADSLTWQIERVEPDVAG